jgi:hypothetical protein
LKIIVVIINTETRAGLGFILNIQPRNEQDLGFITEAAGTSPKISALFFFNARKLVKKCGSLLVQPHQYFFHGVLIF